MKTYQDKMTDRHFEKHVLYMDESGTNSFTDNRPQRGRHFLITALVIEPHQDITLSAYFEYLKKHHGITPGKPFHSYDLFENKTSDLYLTPQKAKKLVESLVEFLKTAPVRYSVFYLNKYNCMKFFRIKRGLRNNIYTAHDHGTLARDIPYDILASKAFWWFTQNVIKNNGRGAIIAESRENSDHKLLDSFLICKSSRYFTPLEKSSKQYRKCDTKLQRLSEKMGKSVTSLKFENKIGECPGLELADLISFVSYLKLEGRLSEFNSKRFNALWGAIKDKMDKKKPHLVQGGEFSQVLPRIIVHKISKFSSHLDTL